MKITEVLPPITRRVIYAAVVMGIGIVTNAWHRNILSGLAIVMPMIALSVWLGLQLSKPSKE